MVNFAGGINYIEKFGQSFDLKTFAPDSKITAHIFNG